MAGTPGDVQSTLSELERKLKELERDLRAVGRSDAPAPQPAPVTEPSSPASFSVATPLAGPQDLGGPAPSTNSAVPATAAPPVAPSAPLVDPEAARIVQDARDRIGGLQGQLGELLRFREELISTANRLVDEYSRVLASLQAGAPAPGLAPPPAPAPRPAGTVVHERVPAAWAAEAAAAGPPPTPAGAPARADPVQLFEGHVSVDAGPFVDIATLSAFEQSLARIPGVGDVYVRGFEGNRALVDVTLSRPVALVSELRGVAPFGFTATNTSPGRVTLEVDRAA